MSDMNICRIRRLAEHDERDLCDFCDRPVEIGYRFSCVSGPRSDTFTSVCDDCLRKARASAIGFLSDERSN